MWGKQAPGLTQALVSSGGFRVWLPGTLPPHATPCSPRISLALCASHFFNKWHLPLHFHIDSSFKKSLENQVETKGVSPKQLLNPLLREGQSYSLWVEVITLSFLIMSPIPWLHFLTSLHSYPLWKHFFLTVLVKYVHMYPDPYALLVQILYSLVLEPFSSSPCKWNLLLFPACDIVCLIW